MFEKPRLLAIPECPFVNLPEKHRSRWGEGLLGVPQRMTKLIP
jgi:hypothetical protein